MLTSVSRLCIILPAQLQTQAEAEAEAKVGVAGTGAGIGTASNMLAAVGLDKAGVNCRLLHPLAEVKAWLVVVGPHINIEFVQ